MEVFNQLVETIDRLLGPGGCPWDQEQTLHSMRNALIEEAYEVIDAIHLKDKENLEEELGDLFFNVIFLSRLAEKEMNLELEGILRMIIEKLIRRHPHVFGEKEIKTSKEALHQWEAIKKEEKSKRDMPKSFPTLLKAEKLIKKFKKNHVEWKNKVENPFSLRLLSLIEEGMEEGLEPEPTLQEALLRLESVLLP